MTNTFTASTRVTVACGLMMIVLSSVGGYLLGVRSLDAAIAEAVIEQQAKNLEVIKHVQEADDLQAALNALRMKQLEEERDALLSKVPNGDGLGAADVERLRKLFQDSQP